MSRDKIYLIVGKSGTGKTTTINAFNKYIDPSYESIKSYTTRPKREGEANDDHVYVDYTYFDHISKHTPEVIVCSMVDPSTGYAYWATRDQVEESDFYVIDFMHVPEFLRNYNGEKRIGIIEFCCDPYLSLRNMEKRLRKNSNITDKEVVSQLKKRCSSDKEWYGYRYYNDIHLLKNIVAMKKYDHDDDYIYRDVSFAINPGLVPKRLRIFDDLHLYTEKVHIDDRPYPADDCSWIYDGYEVEKQIKVSAESLYNIILKSEEDEEWSNLSISKDHNIVTLSTVPNDVYKAADDFCTKRFS